MILRNAGINDAQYIFNIVNEGYSIELGETGIAFKNKNRYTTINEVYQDIISNDGPYFIYTNEDEIFACVMIFVRKDYENTIGFGPFTVAKKYQNQSIGSALLEDVYKYCKENNFFTIIIDVVNHRKDLFEEPNKGFYGKRDFKKKSIIKCDKLNCDKSTTTRDFFFINYKNYYNLFNKL